MSLFNRQKKENILIIGCGRFGSALAMSLSEQNKNVAVVDTNEEAFGKLDSTFGGSSVEGDGSDIDLLTFAGAEDADILVASTDDDNTNIMIAQIARQIFGIKKVIIRLYEPSKQTAFSGMDILSICPAALSVNEFERMINEKGE